MFDPEKSYFAERLRFIEIAKPIWDNICSRLESLLPNNPVHEEEDSHIQEFSGEIYSWRVYVDRFNGLLFNESGKQGINNETAKTLVSPWGHEVKTGFNLEVWFGDTRPSDDGTHFTDDPKAIVICTPEGVYDGYTHEMLTLDELTGLQEDVIKIVAASR